jgi:hypothetical protein
MGESELDQWIEWDGAVLACVSGAYDPLHDEGIVTGIGEGGVLRRADGFRYIDAETGRDTRQPDVASVAGPYTG